MKCRYCNNEAIEGLLCETCRSLIRDYKYSISDLDSRCTVSGSVRKARLEYQLLKLPRPPYGMINRLNHGSWPSALTYINCVGCGAAVLLGEARAHKHEIYCQKCKD